MLWTFLSCMSIAPNKARQTADRLKIKEAMIDRFLQDKECLLRTKISVIGCVLVLVVTAFMNPSSGWPLLFISPSVLLAFRTGVFGSGASNYTVLGMSLMTVYLVHAKYSAIYENPFHAFGGVHLGLMSSLLFLLI